MRIVAYLALLFGLGLGIPGCGYVRFAKTPMAHAAFVTQGPGKARGAIVLLPGFGDRPETFSKQGFVSALHAQVPDYDVFAADAHFGYYRKRTLLKRLDQDVIAPIRRQGYRELWLVGTSMGGHDAIAYARTYPERVNGLLLFAPYMGPKDVVAEVKRAGGLCRYESLAHEESADGFARDNFVWLKQSTCGTPRVPIWLAVGDQDRLLAADKLLADALGPERVLVLPGGHGWAVWTPAVKQLSVRALGGVNIGSIQFDSSPDAH
jgi:pimeloyl-ACP methyl ester carboxylesterase